MNKTLILNSIKDYYRFKNNSEFARYLGITPQVLSNWKSRDTYDPSLIYTKCLDINPHWLLTGDGDMLSSENTNTPIKSEMVDKMDLTKDPRFDVLSGPPERSLEYYEKFMKEQADIIDQYQDKEKEFLKLMKQQGNTVEKLIVLVDQYKQEIIELRSKLNTDQSIG